VRCPRCGNENPGTNRFCGMCGTTLLQEPVPAPAAPPTQATASSALPSPVPTAAPTQTPSPSRPQQTVSISGPSFLGLNDPPPAPANRRGSLSIDPHSAPSSGNLDYLLEDDESPKRGGAGKFFLILVALALAVGFGYLRWKGQGFGWLPSGTHKPSATTQPADETDSSTSTPPSGTTASPSPAPATGQPATSAPAQPAADPAASTSAPASGAGATLPPAAASTPDDGASDSAAGSVPAKQPPAAKEADPNVVDSAPSASTPPTSVKPKPAPVDVAPKAPVVKSAKADAVSEAQKYLYGKGAQQDCDRGLRILKPAADQANPKAMIEMGALYSAGLCAPRDLPTAYRWFAMALRKDPDNQSVQTDLQKLWGEMTQPERQLAIKLSQ